MSRWLSVLNENLGFRGAKNVGAWVVAGSLAYYLWILPDQRKEEAKRIARDRARKHAEERGLLDIDRARPVPDPQTTGLLHGSSRSEK
eukprot:jgi/Botrbrau1/20925/Bobra.0135s0056.1